MSLGQIDGDPMRHRGRSRQHHAASLHLVIGTVLAVAHHDGVGLVHDLLDLSAELDALTQRHRNGLGEGGRAADDAPVETLSDVPHQAEVADARAGRDLVHVAARPGDRGLEQRGRVVGQVADEVVERPLVLEVVDPLLPDRAGLAGPLPNHVGVPQHRTADLETGGQHGRARSERHRDPERVGLDASVADQLAVHRQALQRARYRHGGHADLIEQGVGRRPRPGEDVTAPVQPVRSATLGPDPTPDAVIGFQEDRVPVLQSPGSRQPSESGPHDDDVPHATTVHPWPVALGSPPASSH